MTVHVEIVAESAERTVANAIGGWVEAHPGDHVLVVQVASGNPRVVNPPIATWPNPVRGDMDALDELAAAISEHATAYKIELRDETGQGVHGVHLLGGLPHDWEKPGLVTWGRLAATQSRFSAWTWRPRFGYGHLILAFLVWDAFGYLTGILS